MSYDRPDNIWQYLLNVELFIFYFVMLIIYNYTETIDHTLWKGLLPHLSHNFIIITSLLTKFVYIIIY